MAVTSRTRTAPSKGRTPGPDRADASASTRRRSATDKATASRRGTKAANVEFGAQFGGGQHEGAAAAGNSWPFDELASAFGASVGQTVQKLAGLTLPSPTLQELQADYLKQATELWNTAVDAPEKLAPADRRFAAGDWSGNHMAAFTAGMYLLNARTLLRMAESLQGDEKSRQRVRFAVQQFIDAASPSNYLALNPEVQRLAVESGGKTLQAGLEQLLSDLRRGYMAQTDESVFEVGRNVATTAGDVVFENELIQLIEYRPLTKQVHERPILFVPPCINKFYILDLQPENSLVRYAVEQGHRVFVVSWVNPDESLAQKSWDDYVSKGVLEAINVVRAISGQERINTLGFCVGGTLLATALAVLKSRGESPAHSLTLLTSFLDFSNTGVMDVFVDEALVQVREMTLGAQSPSGGKLLKGLELANTFSFLRPNDLVWNYVIGNYLKGETPPPFDLLYWNSDSTNLPGPMYCWYLRHTYLQNELKQPGKLTVCGEPVDLGSVDVPAFIYASREDHIVPWDGAYASTRVLGGPKRFVLGASGHIAGVINPASKNKRSYWTRATRGGEDGKLSHGQWLDAATEHPGSWWGEWSRWLQGQGGKLVAAPRQPGSKQYPAIEPAPGRYVKRRA